ncbi:MAG: hypothetical protein ACR2OC_05985 [Solirubrobacterales bacterium]
MALRVAALTLYGSLHCNRLGGGRALLAKPWNHSGGDAGGSGSARSQAGSNDLRQRAEPGKLRESTCPSYARSTSTTYGTHLGSGLLGCLGTAAEERPGCLLASFRDGNRSVDDRAVASESNISDTRESDRAAELVQMPIEFGDESGAGAAMGEVLLRLALLILISHPRRNGSEKWLATIAPVAAFDHA